MEKVTENINFYSIFCPMFDTDSIEFNFLEEVRKNFFESGRRQKNKITREFKGKVYHYSYSMENHKPMKWKKMFDGKVLEKSLLNSDGYSILFYDENKNLFKEIFFDNDHDWIKSEYYSKNIKSKPVFSCFRENGFIKACKYDENFQIEKLYDLYPFEFNVNEYKIDAFNEKFTTALCRTVSGEISYCTSEQINKIKDLKRKDNEKIRALSDESAACRAETLIYKSSNEVIQDSAIDEPNNTGLELGKPYEEVTWEEAIGSDKEFLNNNLDCNKKQMKEKIMTKVIKVGENEALFYSGCLDENNGRTGYGRTFNKNGTTTYEGQYLNDKRNGFGVHHYSTGEVFYVGNFKENNKDRLGILFQKNYEHVQVGSFLENKVRNMVSIFDNDGNLEYAGCMQNGKKMGAAVSYTASDDKIFVGAFKDGVYTGRGTIFDKEGNLFYTGEFKGSERCGFGTEYNKDATIKYRGNFYHDQYNGEGILYLSDGRYISGNFKDGQVNGAACEFLKDGHKIYEGDFKNDVYFGKGIFHLENGGYIKGTFTDGEISGTFFEFDKEGNMVYEGDFTQSDNKGNEQHNLKKGNYNGNGALFKDGKCVYKGTFVNGMRSGFGIEYNQGKVTYIGHFKNNEYDGCGMLFRNNKPIFAGNFAHGKKHGRINEIYEDKVIKKCVFENDELKYVIEYSYPDMNIVYYGNVLDGKKNGMGCEFSEYAEKVNEGIFEDGNISRRMSVCMNEIEPLCECKKLNTYGYDKYRKGSDFWVDVSYNGGTYSGAVLESKPHGKGTILYSDHRYTGEFIGGRPMGNGVIYKNDGTKIRGTFSKDKEENSKEVVFPSGAKYMMLNLN